MVFKYCLSTIPNYSNLPLFLGPVIGGGGSHNFCKYPCKIKCILKSKLWTDLVYLHIRKIKVMASLLYFKLVEVFYGRITGLLLKQK